jgi:hypothetical protein
MNIAVWQIPSQRIRQLESSTETDISSTVHFALQPNCKFNVDANSGHAFGIILAAVGALRPCGAPAPVN